MGPLLTESFIVLGTRKKEKNEVNKSNMIGSKDFTHVINRAVLVKPVYLRNSAYLVVSYLNLVSYLMKYLSTSGLDKIP